MLKLLACLLMLIDHIGFYYAGRLPGETVMLMRALGRLAFPIFAWLLARGYTRTRNPLIYFIRMSVFALIAEVVIRLGHSLIGFSQQNTNVLITFALAIVMLSGYHLGMHSFLDMIASLQPIAPTAETLPIPPRFNVRLNPGSINLDPRIGLPLGLLMMLLATAAAIWLKPDYGLYGLATILLFYIIQEKVAEQQQKRTIQAFIILNVLFVPVRIFLQHWPIDWAVLQSLSVLAIPLCYAYDTNRRPAVLQKYFFYFFYPAHIFLLCLFYYLLYS